MNTATKVKKPRAKREKSTATTGLYVRNADLLPAIIEAKEVGFVTNKLIRMIQMIAERYSRKANFVGYSFREDMVSVAVENLCKNALKFNTEKYNNPFAFYTTAIHHSFLQFLADEKKHRNIRDALLIDAGSNPSYNFLQEERDESHFEVKESDEIDFVEEPELLSDEEVSAVESSTEEIQERTPQHERIGFKEKIAGPVTVMSGSDFVLNEHGYYVKRSELEPVIQPEEPKKRRAPAKKAASKPAAAEAKVKEKPTPATKKPATKPATKPTTKAAAKKPTTKEKSVPAKKEPAKKTPAKKTPAKKTPVKKVPTKSQAPAKKSTAKSSTTKKSV